MKWYYRLLPAIRARTWAKHKRGRFTSRMCLALAIHRTWKRQPTDLALRRTVERGGRTSSEDGRGDLHYGTGLPAVGIAFPSPSVSGPASSGETATALACGGLLGQQAREGGELLLSSVLFPGATLPICWAVMVPLFRFPAKREGSALSASWLIKRGARWMLSFMPLIQQAWLLYLSFPRT